MAQQDYSRPIGSSIDQWAQEPFEDGFNTKAILGGLFFAFIMLPGALYMALVAGAEGAMQSAGQWVTVILFTEIARRSFTTLKRQEIIVLQVLGAGLVVAGGPIFSLIYNQFLMQSPEAENFGLLTEMCKPENIWICPPKGSEALADRNLFHRAFIPAIIVVILATGLGRIQTYTLGYTLFRFTSDVERLPFPMAPIAAQGATALADSFGEGRWRWRVFSIGSAIGIVFGMIYIVIPCVTGGVMNAPIQLLPIPFWDLTPKLTSWVPGLLMGIGTNLAAVFVGFVLPWPLVKGQFTGSMLVWIIITPLLLYFGVMPQSDFIPGMDSIQMAINTSIHFWLSGGIGLSLVVAVIGLVVALKTLFQPTDRRRFSAPPKGRGDMSVVLCLAIYVLATAATVWLCTYLVPGFPWWIFAIYGFIWTPLNSFISARLIGLTGSGVGFPFIREGSFVLATRWLDYKGVSVWFAPIPLGDHGFMAQHFRELELTRTSLWSIVKAQFFIFPLIIVCSLLFCGFLWQIAPIPGSAYPFAQKMWPLMAYNFSLWATATQGGESPLLDVINPWYIVTTFIVGFALYAACRIAKTDRLFFYGMIGAAGIWPHNSIPVMTGALIGRYILAKRFGPEVWKEYAPVVCAGCICGIGLAGMVSVGLTLIVNSVIQLPY